MTDLRTFLSLCLDKFGNKFQYAEDTFVDENTEMTIMFHNVSFKMKPKLHLSSETGFPKIVDYDLFCVMAEDALGDEFDDYEFVEDSYETYGLPMTIKYKGTEYRRIPSKVVKYFSRKNPEYEEFKEIAKKYQNYEDMSKDYPLVFPKIRERLWTELIEHFDIYHKDYADIECIKQKISEYKKENKSVEEFIVNEPHMFITLKVSNNYDLLYDCLEHQDILKEPENIKPLNKNDRCIYAYEFHLNNKNYVYVGLTNNHIKRDKEHRKTFNSSVFRFSRRNNIDIPEMKIIIDYEDLKLAKRDEGSVLLNYIDNGYIKINEAKTGSLGGGSDTTKEYTKEYCIKFLKDNNITYRTQWYILHHASYNWAKKKNLLDELMPAQNKNNFTFEECLEDARKYESGKQWMRCSKTMYRYARRQHWLTDITHQLRASTCIAMCSLFDEHIVYYVFEKVSEVEKLVGFRVDGVIRSMTDKRENYMNFVWKRITYKEYEKLKYINDNITEDLILYISKLTGELRITLKKTKPVLVFENDKRDEPIAAYKTSREAVNSPYLKFKKIKGDFSRIIKRCAEGKPLEISNGYFWRYGTFEEYYEFHKKEIDYMKSLGTYFETN